MEEKTAEAATGHTASGCFFCTQALPLLERCFPEEMLHHFRSSRIEFLKGLRSLLDDRIAHLARETEPKGKKITVE